MNSSLVFLAAIAGLVWLVAAARYPRHAVWFLLLWLPVQGWVQLNLFNDSNVTVLIYEVMIIGLYVVFGLRALNAPAQFGPPPLVWVAAPFVVWTLLLVPYGISENGLVLTLVGIRSYLLPLPLVWIGYRTFQTRRQLETVASLLMLQLVIVALVTMLQFTSLTSMSGVVFETPTGYIGTSVIRPPGTFSAPGQLGNYLLFAILLAVGLLGLRTSYWKRVSFMIGLASATLALMANTTRGVMVLLAVALPLTVVLARQRQAVAKLVVAVCVMAAAAAVIGERVSGFALRERVATISGDLERTLIVNPWDRMADALRSPFVGEGLGIASPGVGRLDPGPALTPQVERGGSMRTGESFMAALVYETGVPGLLLFCVFFAAIVHTGLRSLQACKANDMRLLVATSIAFEIAILLASWPYGPLRIPPLRVLFWFWAGVVLDLPRLAAQRAGQPPIAAVRTPAARMTAVMARRLPRARPPAARRPAV